jgi:hypothetical protein
MGNRANVLFVDGEHLSPAVCLHWNGGPESVYAFLAEMERRKCRIAGDPAYGSARFAHIVCDFFDKDSAGALSVGLLAAPKSLSLEDLEPLNHGDNGIYVVETVRNGSVAWKMRRFRGHPLRELDPDEVEQERKYALEHDYNTGEDPISADFLKLRPVVER